MNIEYIKWEDHSGGYSRWTDSADIASDNDHSYTIESVGFVLAENKHRVTLVQNIAVNDMANHTMTIIKKNILVRKILKKGSK